ncbi:hypothetical protein [Halobaculum roseum]|uniref:Uncharacterized protein n=1 Tax=Halobaculum roseum TaxID=2175149 RepID=A0ABD5MLP4_9EURY|nr:hypothetical protein [Halobaculum roseum]QZY02549.1 hypothetical protein K6T36_14840 [Halobaculum roseum]
MTEERDRVAATDGDRTGDGRAGDGRSSDTIADVDHTAPYPEPNDVWSRGFARASDDPRDVRR